MPGMGELMEGAVQQAPQPGRPAVCSQLMPSLEMCGPRDDQGAHARVFLARLEELTRPG